MCTQCFLTNGVVELSICNHADKLMLHSSKQVVPAALASFLNWCLSWVRGSRRLGAQFDAFAHDGIVHLAKAGMRASTIAKLVKKTNGKLGKVDAVRKTIRKHNDSKGKWRGQRKPGSGAPSKLSQTEKDRIVKLLFEKRGSSVATIAYIQQSIPALRRVGRWCIASALHSAGLVWLRRKW